MPFFQDQKGEVHFLSDADVTNGGAELLPEGSLPITDEQAAALQNAPKSQAELVAENNAQIKAQLAELDSKAVRTLHEAVLSLASAGVSLSSDIQQRLQELESQKQELRKKLL